MNDEDLLIQARQMGIDWRRLYAMHLARLKDMAIIGQKEKPNREALEWGYERLMSKEHNKCDGCGKWVDKPGTVCLICNWTKGDYMILSKQLAGAGEKAFNLEAEIIRLRVALVKTRRELETESDWDIPEALVKTLLVA